MNSFTEQEQKYVITEELDREEALMQEPALERVKDLGRAKS